MHPSFIPAQNPISYSTLPNNETNPVSSFFSMSFDNIEAILHNIVINEYLNFNLQQWADSDVLSVNIPGYVLVYFPYPGHMVYT